MKKRTSQAVSAVAPTALLVIGLSSNSLADDYGFAPFGEGSDQAERQPVRYFVKYHQGKESEVKVLLRQYKVEVYDALVKQRVLIVVGEQAEIDRLVEHDLLEYTEQEPINKLPYQAAEF
ncbi:ATPase [Vibrio sp. AND4]|uniref:ATPase n=1 Tax=Vibrio sp. AND4 TaxID=314289 RepID=UPI0002F998F3|nr:ATPase [Vibrio sp. AND4]